MDEEWNKDREIERHKETVKDRGRELEQYEGREWNIVKKAAIKEEWNEEKEKKDIYKFELLTDIEPEMRREKVLANSWKYIM